MLLVSFCVLEWMVTRPSPPTLRILVHHYERILNYIAKIYIFFDISKYFPNYFFVYIWFVRGGVGTFIDFLLGLMLLRSRWCHCPLQCLFCRYQH